MAKRHIRSGEVDTPDEIAKELNAIIDNMNQIEAKVEQLANAPKDKKGDKNA